MIKLPDRLKYILQITDCCIAAADIGSDHGLLAYALLQSNKAKKVIVTDISQKSLNKAKELIKRENLSNRTKFYCTQGFNGIAERFETAVIAGMGGKEITDILHNIPAHTANIILQPMKNAPELRIYLQKHGFFIDTDKKISCGGRYYDIIKAVANCRPQNLSENDIIFGKTNIEEKGSDFYNYLIYEIGRIDNIIKNNAANCGDLPQIRQKTALLLKELYNK